MMTQKCLKFRKETEPKSATSQKFKRNLILLCHKVYIRTLVGCHRASPSGSAAPIWWRNSSNEYKIINIIGEQTADR